MRAPRARDLAAAALLVAVVGCSNRKAPVPGKSCSINSDCENPLSCTYGRCHESCRENGDCPNGGLCVYAPPASPDAQMSEPDAVRLRVCVQESCAMNSECPDLLVCGRDLRCRQECAANKDCPPRNQLCVIGNDRGQKVCAEAMDIGDDGQLSRGDAGTPPANDAGGPPAHDASSSGAGGGGGGHPDVDASQPDDAIGDAPAEQTGTGGRDASGDTPIGSDAVAPDGPADLVGVDVGAGIDAGPIVVTESEPNDDIDMPTPYVLGTEVAGTMGKSDATMDTVDYYEVVAPSGDPSGGYFQAAISHVGGGGTMAASVYSAFDKGQLLLADGAASGQLTFFFWAARPGEHYLVRLYEAGGVIPTFDYSFKVTYTRIPDAYEPNDTSDTPASLALGMPATAYFFAGYNSSNPPTPDQDWYQVMLAAGTTQVSITSVPHDLRMQVQVYDSHFVAVPSGFFVGANAGADLGGSFTTPSSGLYRIAITSFSFVAGSVAGRGVVYPDSFTRPYMITVTQP